jgi:hypothetical protein
MRKLHWAILTVTVSLPALLSVTALYERGYSVEKYDKSPGIYYESKGVAVLYNVEWRMVVYVNLNKIDNETLMLRQYVHHVQRLCQATIVRNWTGCVHFGSDTRLRLNQLAKTEGLLKEITGQETGHKRKKRGVFNFIGELSKVLFGTMDDDDAKYYNDQIKLFEQNSEDMSTLLREQLSVVRSSLGAVNNTLTDVEYNENLLKEGINKVTKYVEMLGKETNEKVNIISMKIEVEEHIVRVNNAIHALQRNLDRLTDSVMNAQKGVIQPQIVSPTTLMEVLIKSVSAFPKDTTLPFPLSKDSVHFIFRVCELQVYVKDGILGYVVLLPLVSRGNFNIYRLIPIPVPLGRSKFLYIDTGKSFLWIDQARQYYFMTDKDWMDLCRILHPMKYVCKQNQPLLSSHLQENCMVKLLHPGGSVPPSCDKRVIEMPNSMWTQLTNNEWIYFVPNSESVTVLCADQPPVDVIVSGIGKLRLSANCKGYGKSVLLQTHSILDVSDLEYESDFMSRVHLEYDCCEDLNVKFNISSVKLNNSFRHVVSHLDDLKFASHKISEVESMIKEEEWKRLHMSSHNTYSVLVYVCLILIGFYVFYKLYNCLKGKLKCVKALSDTTGAGNVVNIKIHTSNESLAMAQEDVPLRELSSPTPETQPRKSHRLRTSKSCF